MFGKHLLTRLCRIFCAIGLCLGWLNSIAAAAQQGSPPTTPFLRIETGMHTAIVNKAAVTHDGRLLTVSDDKTARLWSVGSGLSGILHVPIGTAGEGRLYTVAASPVKDIAVVMATVPS